MPVFEGLLPPKHEDITQTLIFRLAEWHALAKLRLQMEDTLALLDQALRWHGAQVHQFQRVTCAAFETKELPQESTQRQRRELAGMQSGHRKMPAKSSPLPISFNINTYKFHVLGDYSDSKNPFHTNLNGGARSAPPNTVGIALSFGGVKHRRYSWLQERPLGHVIWFTRC